MQLELTLDRGEIARLLQEFTPIRIHLTATDEDRRWVQLDEVRQVELVPGRGVRVQSKGRICYAFSHMKPTLGLKSVVVLLEPKVISANGSGHSLAFAVEIEESDLEFVPGVVDAAIARTVNGALTPDKTGLSWQFSKDLSRKILLPSRLEPLDRLEVGVRSGEVVVETDVLRFRVETGLHITRFKPAPTDDESAEAR
jgi:hypothetical protein